MPSYCKTCVLEHQESKKPGKCKIRARYNYKGLKPLYCTDHSKEYPGMANVKDGCCIFGECITSASYNKPGEKKRIYCSVHKDTIMVPARKLCEEKECEKYPCKNFRNVKGRRYCADHAEIGMVMNDGMCEEKECKKRASYNFKDKKKRRRCFDHHITGMINLNAQYCEIENCKTQSVFNFSNKKKATRCERHHMPGMVDIVSTKCKYENKNEKCDRRPIYNLENNKPLFCFQHKTDDMIDVVSTYCLFDKCYVRGSKKYDYYCTFCFVNLFRDDHERIKNIFKKSKEAQVRVFLNDMFEDLFIHDRILETATKTTCRRRVDHRTTINNTILCIETDEFQHKSYDKDDEERRINSIFEDAGGKKLIFIRFNPDSFKDNSGIRRTTHMKTRLNKLELEINKQMKRIRNDENKDLAETIYLYYDGYKL